MTEYAGRMLAGLVLLVLAVAPAPVALADDESQANVQLTVRMGKMEGNRQVPVKMYQLNVVPGGAGSRLLSGMRVPIPTVSTEAPPGEDEETTSYTYQNVGFATDVRAWILDGKRIKIAANLEDSRVIPAEDGGPPSVETKQVAFDVVLEDGKPLVVAAAEGLADQPGYVEVEARIQR